MENPPAGFHFVDVLPARPTATAAVFLDVLRVDVDLHIRQFRQNRHRRGTGVDAPLRLRLRHALHAMAASVKPQMPVSAAPLDVDDALLEPAAFTDGKIRNLESPSLAFAITAVHFKKHARKQRRLFTARSCAQFQEK